MRRPPTKARGNKVAYKVENTAFNLSDQTADLSVYLTSMLRSMRRSHPDYAAFKAANSNLKAAASALYKAYLQAKAVYQRSL
jgi:hypothetical protein